MTTPAPSHYRQQNALNIEIKPYPFNSAVAHKLITALDDELAAMYPDWEDLPHPGFRQGFVGGDQSEYKANPVPKTFDEQISASALDALDAKDSVDTPSDEIKAATGTDVGTGLAAWKKDLMPDDISKLHFHAAFDASHLSSADTTTGAAIGCIGLKLMPHFPHHRAQTSEHPEPGPIPSHPRIAEIKRLYIAPAYRGTRLPNGQRLAEALVSVAADYARRELHADKLVLETGVRQLAAIRLYEKMGWYRREVYGDYVGAGVEDGGVSMCFGFDL